MNIGFIYYMSREFFEVINQSHFFFHVETKKERKKKRRDTVGVVRSGNTLRVNFIAEIKHTHNNNSKNGKDILILSKLLINMKVSRNFRTEFIIFVCDFHH